MLLIFPPVAKACEPPAGVAKLAGALAAHGRSCTVLDANLEGLLHLLQQPQTTADTWTRRALKNISGNLAALRDPRTYRSFDRYSRAVRDVQRVLQASAGSQEAVASLADYRHPRLSPVRSADLIAAAAHPEENPFYPYFSRRLPEILDDTLVGFSLNYLSQALSTFAMIGQVKKEFPGVKIVLGGSLVTSWMKRPDWRSPFAGLVDHLVAGPGEVPLLDLAGVKGPQPLSAPPAYAALPLQDYLAPGFILPYSGASGCLWHQCSFCPEAAEDNPYVPVPVKQVFSDLDILIPQTKPVLIHFLDNALSPLLLRALAENPPGVPWYGFARVDERLKDLDYCLALKRSGCAMLKLGLESGDQAVLDRMQKGIDLETASQALRNLAAAGIAAYVYLLFGTPAETAREARKTLAFVVRHREAINFLNLAVFNMPLCGAEAGAYATEEFYAGDLSLYTGFRHPRGWDRKSVRQFLEGEFKRDPAVAAILKKDPPVFTSNHAAFFASGGKTAGL